jgi:hypothetical protein
MANASRFIGVTGNVYGGTAKGESAGGGANANIGGIIYRGSGQSSNQFPVSQAVVQFVGGGGSAPATTTSSNNPLTVQEETSDRVNTEVVAQTTLANVSSPAAGMLVNFPKSNKTADFGSSSSVSSNIVLRTETPTKNSAGITVPQALSSQDPDFLAQERTDVEGTNAVTDGRIDGKAQGANNEDKFQSVNGENLMTPSMTTLPGGVSDSSQIG